jgi:hypothetical protein
MCMSAISKLSRALGNLIAGLAAAILVGAVGIHVDHYFLRRDAERLLLDLKSLEMRKSTYRDARRVIDQWYDDVHQEGACAPYWCDVQISLGGFFERHPFFFASRPHAVYLYQLLGGRPAEIRGFIRVRNNIVWGKGIGAYVASDFIREPNGGWLFFTLIGRAGSGSPGVIVAPHPEYRVGQPGGCTGCTEGYVTFTPYANPADVARLMDINFSCITRWYPCKTQADILPTAWNEAVAEEPIQENAGQSCTPDMIRVLGRESTRVAIGTVIKVQKSSGYEEITVTLSEDLKRRDLLRGSKEYSSSHPLPVKEKVGERYIVFLAGANSTYDVSPYRACDLVPASLENIEITRRGITENWQDHYDEVLFRSLGDVKSPTDYVR